MPALPDDVRSLFDGANFAHLATLMPDGSPHSVAVWAGLEGDHVVFFTQEGSLKARNLTKDPRVAISITDHEDPYHTAQLRGEVVEVRDAEAANELADQLGRKYTGEPFPYKPPTSRLYVVAVHRVRSTQLPFEHRPAAA
jgi:PPOX class probable F420-dependent enzyme